MVTIMCNCNKLLSTFKFLWLWKYLTCDAVVYDKIFIMDINSENCKTICSLKNMKCCHLTVPYTVCTLTVSLRTDKNILETDEHSVAFCVNLGNHLPHTEMCRSCVDIFDHKRDMVKEVFLTDINSIAKIIDTWQNNTIQQHHKLIYHRAELTPL